MIVYQENCETFMADVRDSKIDFEILTQFKEKLNRSTSQNEITSWANSMQYMKNVLELNRLVVKEGCAKFTASRLIAVALKELAKKGDFVIVSYADSQWGHVGKVYQATNWIYTGLTRKRTDPYCGGKHSRHYDRSPEAMKIREVRHPKHRYVMFVGPNRKKMRKDLKWSVEPYPIGDSVRYDVNNPTPVNE